MNIILLILLLFTSKIRTNCTQGCLKCTAKNTCQFCDSSQFFVLEEDECQKSEIENCEMMTADGNCYKCEKDFYLNSQTKRCIAVPEGSLIENCLYYSNQRSCSLCRRNFTIKGSQCQEVEESIDNCEFYSSQNSCLECKSEYLLSADKKKCEESPSKANCGFYQRGSCRGCKKGYILNYHQETDRFLDFSNTSKTNELSIFLNEIVFGKPGLRHANVCQEISVKNCMFPISAEICGFCELTYILTEDKKCQRFPIPGILNCQKYLHPLACLKCQNRFFLRQETECSPVSEILNCAKYDGSASSTKCLECSEGYFSTGQFCQIRNISKSIVNCSKPDPTADRCSVCTQQFLLSSTQLKCLSSIANCEKHLLTIGDTVSCEICRSSFFIKNGSCSAGQVANCNINGSTATDCVECSNEFYLSGNQCLEHQEIAGCEIYDKITPDTCRDCSKIQYHFKVSKICKFQNPINNCIEYTETLPVQCTKCELGFFIEGNTCEIIPVPSCAIFDNGKCTACLKDHALSTSQDDEVSCSQIFTFLEQNCDKTNLDKPFNTETMQQAVCEQCVSFNIPLDHKNHYVCVRNDQLSSFGITQDKLMPNCIKYNEVGVCVQCEKSKFLENNKCVDQCLSTVYRMIKYKKSGTESEMKIIFDGYRECVPSANPETEGREILGFDVTASNQDQLDITVKCKKGFLPIVYTLNLDFTNLDYNSQPENYVKVDIRKFPGIAVCAAPTDTSPIIPNCEYYNYVQIRGNFDIRCLKCQHGYHSIISQDQKKANSSRDSSYFLNQCVRNSQCRSNFKDGLDIIWIKFYSCHECSNSNQIPFIALEMERSKILVPKQVIPFHLGSVDHTQSPNPSQKSVFCLQDSAESLGYDINNPSQLLVYQKLPENCALAIINLSAKDGDSRNNQTQVEDNKIEIQQMSHFCTTCKAGYRDTPINNLYFFVKTKCTKIENCEGTEWFNNCSLCSNGFTWGVTNFLIDYSKCKPTNDSNCYAVTDEGICGACKRGFNLNDDFRCEIFSPANCKSSNNFNKLTEYPNRLNLFYGLYHDSLGVGCNECRSGHSAIKLTESSAHPYICTSSLYLQAASQILPEQSNFIQFCENYAIKEDRRVCVKCMDSGVLDSLGTKCFQGPMGCLMTESLTRCIKCSDNLALVGGLCEHVVISNCKKLNSEVPSDSVKCAQCEPGYFLNQAFECQQGYVPNCEVFQMFLPNKCQKCLEGFAQFSNLKADYCYKISEDLNCKDAEIRSSNVYGAEIFCTTCKSPNFLITSSSEDIVQNSICMNFTEIENCQKYDKNEEIATSTFACIECKENFFNNLGLQCLPRTYRSDLCEKYAPIQDSCWVCKEEAFIDLQGFCNPNPTGIANCINYSNQTTCELCNEEYFLEGNKCLKVLQKIVGCKFYSSETTCSICLEKYYLNGAICELAIASNCKTYINARQCEKCLENFGLSTTDGITNCILVAKPNCLEFEQSGDFKCLKCTPKYFSNESGNCELANPEIQNCQVYENNDECKQCIERFALSQDFKTCIEIQTFAGNFDTNCVDFVDQVVCSVCRPGSIFEGTSCISCADSLGCYKCDLMDTSSCIMCQTGFYMNADEKCVRVDSGSSYGDSDFFGIKEIFFHLFVLILI